MSQPDLWPQQKTALDWIATHERAWLSIPMGGGKTRVVMEAIMRDEVRRTLVIAPARVVPVWDGQARTWLRFPWQAVPLHPGRKLIERASILEAMRPKVAPSLHSMAVTNYEALLDKSFVKAIKKYSPELVVFDECHRLKSPTGKLYKAARKVAEDSGLVIQMTGTPMPHSPLDLWAQSKIIDPEIFPGPFSRFQRGDEDHPGVAVMGGPHNTWVTGYRVLPGPNYSPSMAEWLVERLDKCLCEIEVPNDIGLVNTFTTHELPGGSRSKYHELLRDWVVEVDDGDGVVAPQNALVRLLRLAQLASGYLPADDFGSGHIRHLGRYYAFLEILEGSQEPIVVGCRFRHELDFVRRAAEVACRSYGEISGESTSGLTAEGRHAGQRVLGVQFQAGGVGIDLSLASLVVMFGHTYSLGDYDQFIGRMRRPGQESDTVRVVHLLAEDTVDYSVYEAHTTRREVVDVVLQALRARRLREGR